MEYLTTAEVAEQLRVSDETVRTWAKRRMIAAANIGTGRKQIFRFTPEAVRDFMEQRMGPTPATDNSQRRLDALLKSPPRKRKGGK